MKETGKPVFYNAFFTPVNVFCFRFAKFFDYFNFMVEITPVIFQLPIYNLLKPMNLSFSVFICSNKW